MANPIQSAQGGARSLVTFIRAHPVAFLFGGILFGAFLWPMVRNTLAGWRAKGGLAAKLIPETFTVQK